MINKAKSGNGSEKPVKKNASGEKPVQQQVDAETLLQKKTLHEEAHKEHQARNYGQDEVEVKLENNEVYDEAELASAYESAMISKALEDHKQKMAPQTHPNFDGMHCIDCEDEIPEGRLKMGRIRCKDCQEHLENLQKRRG